MSTTGEFAARTGQSEEQGGTPALPQPHPARGASGLPAGSKRPPAGDRTHEWRATYPESRACTACGKPTWVTHRASGRCFPCQKGGAA